MSGARRDPNARIPSDCTARILVSSNQSRKHASRPSSFAAAALWRAHRVERRKRRGGVGVGGDEAAEHAQQ
eukprot:134159-Pleurochrysis_carterae.AAC.1